MRKIFALVENYYQNNCGNIYIKSSYETLENICLSAKADQSTLCNAMTSTPSHVRY